MRKLIKIAAAILSMILGASGGCALEVDATRPGESFTLHVTPATQLANAEPN